MALCLVVITLILLSLVNSQATNDNDPYTLACSGVDSCMDRYIKCPRYNTCKITCSHWWSCGRATIICPEPDYQCNLISTYDHAFFEAHLYCQYNPNCNIYCGGVNGACVSTIVYWSAVNPPGNITCAHQNSNDPTCDTLSEKYYDQSSFIYTDTAITNVFYYQSAIGTGYPTVHPTIDPTSNVTPIAIPIINTSTLIQTTNITTPFQSSFANEHTHGTTANTVALHDGKVIELSETNTASPYYAHNQPSSSSSSRLTLFAIGIFVAAATLVIVCVICVLWAVCCRRRMVEKHSMAANNNINNAVINVAEGDEYVDDVTKGRSEDIMQYENTNRRETNQLDEGDNDESGDSDSMYVEKNAEDELKGDDNHDIEGDGHCNETAKDKKVENVKEQATHGGVYYDEYYDGIWKREVNKK